MTNAKVQHYVPQFLLRNFCNGKKDQVWVYEKSSGRNFPSNTKNVASESRFYDFEHEGQTLSLESWLSDLEGNAKSVISEILEADSVSILTNEQKQTLASFLAVQFTRTKTFRDEWNSIPGMLREHFERAGDQVAPGSQAEEFLREISDNESKGQTAKIVFDAPSNYVIQILDKHWILASTSRERPFVLSDNPVTRQNQMEGPDRGVVGLSTPGVEIYLPLSPTRALALWSSDIVDLVHREARVMIEQQAVIDTSDPEGLVALSNALDSGSPVQYSAANVENFNALQVAWSERYIFSASNDFHFVRTLLEMHPGLKFTRRSTIS